MKRTPHAPLIEPSDAERWGLLRAAVEGRPRLTRFADLVREAMAVHGLAQVEAAEAVLREVPAGGVFILNREGPAARVQEGQGVGHVRLAGAVALLSGEPEFEAFDGPQGVLGYLRWHWVKRGCADTDLDGCRNPAWAPRAGRFALLEADAQALLVSLGEQIDAPSLAASKAAHEAVEAACVPPVGFKKKGGWTVEWEGELLRQKEALMAAGLTYEGALIVLHKNWGYKRNPEAKGGSLAKVLTRAKGRKGQPLR